MIGTEKHLVSLGVCECGCNSKRYLVVRERKKGLIVYLIVEDSNRKRKYHLVTKIAKSALDHRVYDNLRSRDGGDLREIASQLRSISNAILSRVTESEKGNTGYEKE